MRRSTTVLLSVQSPIRSNGPPVAYSCACDELHGALGGHGGEGVGVGSARPHVRSDDGRATPVYFGPGSPERGAAVGDGVAAAAVSTGGLPQCAGGVGGEPANAVTQGDEA